MKLVPKVIEKYGLILRLIEIKDAPFILELRSDSHLGKYLSKTSNRLEDQIEWIENYKLREAQGEEYYFVALDENDKPLGTTRISELKKKGCFELGSWLFSKNSPPGSSILADIITREIGYDLLEFDCCKFSVRKDNKSVISYHKKFLPHLKSENDLDMFFTLAKADFNKCKIRILKFYNYGN